MSPAHKNSFYNSEIHASKRLYNWKNKDIEDRLILANINIILWII